MGDNQAKKQKPPFISSTPRKVVGWALDRSLQARLPRAALERALAERQPPPGLVHHSDRGVQYACKDYVKVLRDHQMIPSMSRPTNPYDNASCESFLKTLKREEIYANRYDDLEHLRTNIEDFIERYYNRCRLHSALGYRSPEEFEKQSEQGNARVSSLGATLRFFRSGEIDGQRPGYEKGLASCSSSHRAEDAADYLSAGFSAPELASASSGETRSERGEEIGGET